MHIHHRHSQRANLRVQLAIGNVGDEPMDARLPQPSGQLVQLRALVGQDQPVVPGIRKIRNPPANSPAIGPGGVDKETNVDRLFHQLAKTGCGLRKKDIA